MFMLSGTLFCVFIVLDFRAVPVRHPCAKISEEVFVRFIISEGTHSLRLAKHAFQNDPGRKLALLV